LQVTLINMTKKIVFLATGGTIAGRASSSSDNVGYVAAQVGVDDLLTGIAGLVEALAGQTLVPEQIAQVDSKDMGFEVWQRLAQRITHYLAQDDVSGVVVTHGTDTLEETAYFLHAVLPHDLLAIKPVVLTCAMRPASSQSPDGPQNVLDALSVINTPGAHGVSVVCAGTVHAALSVQKVHPYRLDAFSSGDSGPIAYVEEGVVRLVNQWSLAGLNDAYPAAQIGTSVEHWPRVEIVLSYVGASGANVDALLLHGHSAGQRPVVGLVVAATGNGTIHQDLELALLRAVKAGVSVVVSTRCPQGSVIAHKASRFKVAAGLSPVKARIALMLSLMTKAA
jgi:L-asparaginase